MDSTESTFDLHLGALVDGTVPSHVVSIKGVIPRDDRILLLRKPNGRWDLPGGKLETGEGVIDGLRREVAEETSLWVDVEGIVDSWVRTRPLKPSKFVVTYICRLIADRPVVKLSDEHVDHGFFTPADLAGLPMLDGTRGSVNAVFSRWANPVPRRIEVL